MSDLVIKHAGTTQTQGSQGPISAGAALGQSGAAYIGDAGTLTPTDGKVFVAIQIIEDSVFNSTNGLKSEDDTKWPNTQSAATAIDSDSEVVDSVTFPAGITIYGRWNQIILASGKIIAYLG
tara:strand:+ start:1816 stop:2181 length:366 start_codon:yes stop_codon:yes gene_type:complete